MSDQDYAGLVDLWSAIKKSAVSGHSGPNAERIIDGCLFVTDEEWNAISDSGLPEIRDWSERTPIERLSAIPIRIVKSGEAVQISGDRVVMNFAETLYLMPSEVAWNQPPLPRLHVDGRYITASTERERP